MFHLKSAGFLILLMAFSLYSYWISNKDYQWIVPYMNDRTPAAVRDSGELSTIVEKPLRVFKRESVSHSIRIREKKEKKLTFSMGQFPVNASKGVNLLCLEYPKLRLRFIAEGMSVGGKKPTTTITSPCRVNNENKDYISDIPLPFHESDRLPAQDGEYGEDAHKVHLDFEEIVGDWPREWILESIEFYKEDMPSDAIVISREEITSKLGSPIVILTH
ncbi:MAG: hypothetical protein K2Q26_13830 [Bdellovibrionales bacterium]|nr:hypothetical protein [Bdellovibrionales bacterium]